MTGVRRESDGDAMAAWLASEKGGAKKPGEKVLTAEAVRAINAALQIAYSVAGRAEASKEFGLRRDAREARVRLGAAMAHMQVEGADGREGPVCE